jgi:hypothetical protein
MVDTSWLIPQFPDTTELKGIYHLNADPYRNTPKVTLTLLEKWIPPTQFIFATSAPQNLTEQLIALEFKPLSKMKNCSPAHKYETRILTFWWKKMLDKQEAPVPVRRECYPMSSIPRDNLCASSCGFKLFENRVPAAPFFSLLRMPLDLSEAQLACLKKRGYYHIDTGSFATFWLNGDPIGGGK